MNGNSGFQLVDNHGRAFALHGSRTQLGRSADNQIVVQDTQASRHHATIFVQAGHYYVQDEGSTNGTRLNGKRITGPQPLNIGDRVTIGTTEFVVQPGAAAPAQPMRGGYAAPVRQTSALPYVVVGAVAAATIVFLIVAIALSAPRPTNVAQAAPTPVIASPSIPATVAPSPVIPTVVPPSPAAASPTALLPTALAPNAVKPIPTETIEVPNLPTLPPPLSEVDFPAQAIAYPVDWPKEIRYPSTFKLVGVASGILQDGKTKGWSAKLIYAGRSVNARTDLSSFFVASGWRIVESTQLDSDGWQMFLQRNNNSQRGSVLIGPDVTKPDSAKLLVSIFL